MTEYVVLYDSNDNTCKMLELKNNFIVKRSLWNSDFNDCLVQMQLGVVSGPKITLQKYLSTSTWFNEDTTNVIKVSSVSTLKNTHPELFL